MATGISILSRLLRCTLHFRDGSIARITASQHFCPLHPNKQTRQDGLNATLCASNGHMQCSREHPYSITSSARASNGAGTSSPIVLAAWRLITSSNLVDCWTGRSAGLAPFRMRPA